MTWLEGEGQSEWGGGTASIPIRYVERGIGASNLKASCSNTNVAQGGGVDVHRVMDIIKYRDLVNRKRSNAKALTMTDPTPDTKRMKKVRGNQNLDYSDSYLQ